MPGERTPDHSTSSAKGSSDDDISLREHMQRQLDALSNRLDRQLDALTIHFDDKIDALERLLDERYDTQTKAIEKAEDASEKRFEGVNEFRKQLGDQAATFMPRLESVSRHDRTNEALQLMNLRNIEAIQALQTRHDADMAAVNKRLDLNQGRSTGLDKAWGYIGALVGLAAAIIGIVIGTR